MLASVVLRRMVRRRVSLWACFCAEMSCSTPCRPVIWPLSLQTAWPTARTHWQPPTGVRSCISSSKGAALRLQACSSAFRRSPSSGVKRATSALSVSGAPRGSSRMAAHWRECCHCCCASVKLQLPMRAVRSISASRLVCDCMAQGIGSLRAALPRADGRGSFSTCNWASITRVSVTGGVCAWPAWAGAGTEK